jgi:proline iminopeptidase
MTPDEFTNQEFYLDVSDGHRLYVQDWGKAEAKTPILFLHGGPGYKCSDRNKTIFDPTSQRVIFHDQRGSGNSQPYGSLEHNTTQDLIADIEKLVTHLSIDKFILTGGSWGSALAFYYAVQYPYRIKAMVLDGVLTLSSDEIDWISKGKFQTFFPEAWAAFLSATPKSQQHDPSGYHLKRMLGDDSEAAKTSAYVYQNLEGALLRLDDRFTPESYVDYDPAGARIEAHYIANNAFVPDKYVFKHLDKLTMPIWLVQGRYDIIAPPFIAYELDQLLPDSHLILTVSGHADSREAWNVKRTILLQLAGAD